jgi:putative serine protease PepD
MALDVRDVASIGEADEPSEPAPREHRRRWLVAVALVVVIAATVAVTRDWSTGSSSSPATSSTLDPETQAAIDDAVTKAEAAQGLPVPQVYAKIEPSLVYIQVEESGDSGKSAGDNGTGLGSGVVVNADGSILTALHVVKDATTIEVVFSDGTRSAAKIESSDPDNDIATLTADTLPSVIVPAVIGSSQGVSVGDTVVAVGHPLGLIGTTTAGVVSGLDRSITETTDTKLSGLIQFDAAVNPGSSGGPLLNSRGETIGIVVALADPSQKGFFIGIGFAVPVGAAVGGGGRGPQK